jgi:uncharacterized protein
MSPSCNSSPSHQLLNSSIPRSWARKSRSISLMTKAWALIFLAPLLILGLSMSGASKNVLGGALQCCCLSPKTGFYRDGFCQTGPMDTGSHTVCAVLTNDFLDFTKRRGNDLSTPRPEYNFPGLKEGDKWCLCAARWLEAQKAGHAPLVDLDATNEKALNIVPKDLLVAHSYKKD